MANTNFTCSSVYEEPDNLLVNPPFSFLLFAFVLSVHSAMLVRTDTEPSPVKDEQNEQTPKSTKRNTAISLLF